jgi:RHS repeat-associated protein
VGNLLVGEKTGNIVTRYLYNESEMLGFNRAGSSYFYVKNLQGDVISVVGEGGEIVNTYSYDAWGSLLSCDEEVPQPIRYRGYYYDGESGLYYCQSRYYNHNWGRWINLDEIAVAILLKNDSLFSSNLFAYCLNDPVNYSDQEGYWVLKTFLRVVYDTVSQAVYKNKTLKSWTINGINYANSAVTYMWNNWSFVNQALTKASLLWDSNKEIFYYANSSWLAVFGYADIFNKMAPFIGVLIDDLPLDLKYNNETWRIWLWKGTYGPTIGGEIGFYNKKFSIPYGPYREKYQGLEWYRAARKGKYDGKNVDEWIGMEMTIYLGTKKLFNRASSSHWWLTGFKLGLKPANLRITMKAKLTFKNEAMAKAFMTTSNKKKITEEQRNGKVVSFTW